ncbi:hypothetical protein [Streptomyces cyaneofuscatus]|uniref:hypothetical protein n=1 Tax=Streptomyces cyaneofuscatus TaxID=66883 RepID=UPI0036526C37
MPPSSVLVLVLVLVAAVLFALLPGALSEARDFRAARPCTEIGGSAVENGDCLSEWPATVVSTETGRKKKAVTYRITLDLGAAEQPFRIRMRSDGPVGEKLAPGDAVTAAGCATAWTASVLLVRRLGGQRTPDAYGIRRTGSAP